ncbi:MAG TPA: hypothetical protein VEL76_36245, partial [Gemmataceae bacterium]|nr:hypothetical protein [Gemmataceae bacterium]
MGRVVALAVGCLVAIGCEGSDGGSAASKQDPLEVYETVFRYRLQKHPREVSAYLTVDGKDIPASVLGRLRKDWPNLKAISEEPKERGLRIYVNKLKWIDTSTAEVEAGYWFPTKFAGEGYFGDHHVVRRDGRWVVAKITNETSS